MLKKMGLLATGMAITALAILYSLSVQMLRRLPEPDRVSLDGITTLEEAVAACKRANLSGWELAAYAQQLVARKFTYSRLNSWETPARAFARGRGYCEQQALALKRIYDQSGIEARPVFSLRCKFPPKVVDGIPWPGGISGHAWLRVRIGEQELDVCPGSPNNTPGVTHFEVLGRVHNWRPWLRPWTHVGSSLENMRRDLLARRSMR